ncbi:MAG TPA: hypothetical protein VIK89_15695 [Cytophagaceae bacterium]
MEYDNPIPTSFPENKHFFFVEVKSSSKNLQKFLDDVGTQARDSDAKDFLIPGTTQKQKQYLKYLKNIFRKVS